MTATPPLTAYELNLIDTPGHVDFTYEVSRALAACEGALLVVDASQGIEAQTLANVYMALELDLTVIPVVNKIDLASAEPERVAQELVDVIGFKREEVLFVSAKEGTNVPAAGGDRASACPACGRPGRAAAGADLRLQVRLVQGRDRVRAAGRWRDRTRQRLRLMSERQGRWSRWRRVLPAVALADRRADGGEVGYVATGLKTVRDCHVGDTLTTRRRPRRRRCPATGQRSRWCSRACTRPTPRTTRCSATPSRSCS